MPIPDRQGDDIDLEGGGEAIDAGAAPLSEMVTTLRTMIREARLDAYFQPIVCHETGAPIGYEAFTRPAPGSPLSSATALFDAAESAGMQWELEDASRGLVFQHAADVPEGLLFINVSPAVLADARFPERLDEQVRACRGISPDRLVIEITERAEHGSVERLARRVLELKNLGYQIAVDDVGAGVSGLNRLMLLRPHWLKLDRELTTRLDEDRYKQNLIQFLVHFANLSGVRLIAEGVERREELATLIDSGIRHSQGYLLARPARDFPRVDVEVGGWARRRWSQAMMHGRSDPRRVELSTLCQPALCAQAQTTAASMGEAMLRDPEALGVVVMDGRRFIGWCGRETILEAARGARSGQPLGMLTAPGVTTLAPDASISEALSLVSVRSDEELFAPLVIAQDYTVVGIVPMRALIAAAAQGGRPSVHGAMPLTGLPGRVAADRHLTHLLARVPAGTPAPAHLGAVFVDIRQFEHINLAVGYDAGDRVIRALGDSLHAHIVQRAASVGVEAFVAHLGDDRFLAFAPAHVLDQALDAVTDDFNVMIDASPLPPESGGRVGLRVLRLPAVLRRVSGPRDLHRAEAQLRQRARALESKGEPQRVVSVVDQRLPDRLAGWMTA